MKSSTIKINVRSGYLSSSGPGRRIDTKAFTSSVLYLDAKAGTYALEVGFEKTVFLPLIAAANLTGNVIIMSHAGLIPAATGAQIIVGLPVCAPFLRIVAVSSRPGVAGTFFGRSE